MRNSWEIFKNDLKSISTHVLTAIIVGGLIFLPSLYAWLNITASWDPYAQTDQIPVGVVNEDIGEDVRGEAIDVGGELVETLKKNDALDWKFLNRNEANEQLEKGDLFAIIMIPSDFSEKLGTVIQTNPEKANVEYYVNEKINAIAPKITEKGASVIVEDISSQFISTVNGIIFDMFNEIGLELEQELPDIKQFEKYIFEMEKRLPEIHDTLEESRADATVAQGMVEQAKNELPKADKVVSGGLETTEQAKTFLNDAEKRLNQIGPHIKRDLLKAQEHITQMNAIFNEIKESDIDFEQIEEEIKQLDKEIDDSIQSVESVERALLTILEQIADNDNPDEEQIVALETTLEELQQMKEFLMVGADHIAQITSLIEKNEQDIEEVFNEVKELTVHVGEELNGFINEYNESIEPTVLEQIAKTKDTLSSAHTMLIDVQTTIPEINQLLSQTSTHLNSGEDMLDDMLLAYPFVNDKIVELANRIRNMKEEADINDVIELLQNDPDAEKNFFKEPVQLTENKVFPIENYGSGMTPFYTVLSLWVGGLLLISILSTNVRKPELYQAKDIYFGKLGTFVLIGFLQTLIVTNGDIFLINVDVAHPIWFVMFGLFVSFIFMTMIYTFVSIFGDVGKAMAIIMLVLQIAGSGGTYPVVLLPQFFQTISPFLPFTYAVNLMREAVGGIVWGNALFDLMMLSIFGTLIIIIGMLLKGPINKLMNKLMSESTESDVFQ